MQIHEHFTSHALEYLLAGFFALAGIGALAYMDLRHITRVDWIQSEISEQEQEIQRLELYNQFGTEGNKPARIQIIRELENKKSELERDLKELE